MRGEVSAVANIDRRIVAPVQHKAQHANVRGDVANIYGPVHARQGNDSARARTLALKRPQMRRKPSSDSLLGAICCKDAPVPQLRSFLSRVAWACSADQDRVRLTARA